MGRNTPLTLIDSLVINQIFISPNLQSYYKDKAVISTALSDKSGSADLADYRLLIRSSFGLMSPKIQCEYRHTQRTCNGLLHYQQYLREQTPHPFVLRLMLHMLMLDRYQDVTDPAIVDETFLQIIQQGETSPDCFYTITPDDFIPSLTPELAATIKPINSSLDLGPILHVLHRRMLHRPDKALTRRLAQNFIRVLTLCTPPGERPELFSKLADRIKQIHKTTLKNAFGHELVLTKEAELHHAQIEVPQGSRLHKQDVIDHLEWIRTYFINDLTPDLTRQVDYNQLSLTQLISDSTKALKVSVIKEHIDAHTVSEQALKAYCKTINTLLTVEIPSQNDTVSERVFKRRAQNMAILISEYGQRSGDETLFITPLLDRIERLFEKKTAVHSVLGDQLSLLSWMVQMEDKRLMRVESHSHWAIQLESLIGVAESKGLTVHRLPEHSETLQQHIDASLKALNDNTTGFNQPYSEHDSTQL